MQRIHTENAVGDSTVALGDDCVDTAVGYLPRDIADSDDDHLSLDDVDHDLPPSMVHARLEPNLSSSLQAAPSAASPSHIDSIVAMGFQLEAAEVAYAKSNGDVQVRQFFIFWFDIFH